MSVQAVARVDALPMSERSIERKTLAVVTSALRAVARTAAQYDALNGVAQRADGWANLLSGAGSLTDKTSRYMPVVFRRLSDSVLVTLFHTDPTSRKACELRPKAALQNGVLFNVAKDVNAAPDLAEKVLDDIERLDLINKMTLAATWENLFGGAALWVAVDDGHYDVYSQVRELDLANVERVLFVRELDRRQIWPDYGADSIDQDPESPTFGHPTIYNVDGGNGYMVRVHKSRLIIFPGATTTYDMRLSWNGWGVSVLDVAWSALQRSGMVWTSAANLVANAQYTLYKIADLKHMLLAPDGEKQIKVRAQAIEMAKSMINAVIVDGEDEYTRENPNFGNMPEMMDLFMYDTASALDMTVTKLFGRSPAGMNSTGESDDNQWIESVKAYWEKRLRMAFHRMLEIQLAAKQGPSAGVDPGGWKVCIPPLKQMSDADRADIYLKTAQGDQIYETIGVLTSNEIATSRFRANGYSQETSIDLDAREALMAHDKDQLEANIQAGIATSQATKATSEATADDPTGAKAAAAAAETDANAKGSGQAGKAKPAEGK